MGFSVEAASTQQVDLAQAAPDRVEIAAGRPADHGVDDGAVVEKIAAS